MSDRLVVITPWFPTPEEPGHGSFVAASVAAIAHLRGESIPVVQLRSVPIAEFTTVTVTRLEHEYGPLIRIDVPAEPLQARLLTALAMRKALADNMPDEVRDATVVHVHTGMPTGIAVVPLLREDQRVVMTEHASYLQRVFVDPPSKAAYGEAANRCAFVMAVSEALGRAISSAYPFLGNRVVTVANPVPTASIPRRAEQTEQLDDWLVVSSLIPRKNIDRILRVFGMWHADRPEATLTVIGEGPERESLTQQVSALGLDSAVTFLGNIPHSDVLQRYHEYSLFMHLSSHETFGVVLAEAVAAGLCVVSASGAAQREVLREAVVLDVASLARLEGDDEDIIKSVQSLERPDRGDDMDLAIEHIDRRFSPVRVAEAIDATYRGQRPPRASTIPFRIVVLADPYSRKAPQMLRAIHTSMAIGAIVVLVTRRGAKWRGLPPELPVIGVSGSMRWAYKGTRVAIALFRLPLALLARVPKVGRKAQRALAAYDVAAAKVRRLVEAVLNHLFVPYLRGRSVLRHVDSWAEGIDLIIADGTQWTPAAWRLCKLNPQVDVRSSISSRQLKTHVAATMRNEIAATTADGIEAG
ncbi:MAG: hypothetical protein QOH99_1150 [Frankiaceae bacterium]|nr:hypothetical protein [Frankiaceae bacterium]